MLTTMPESLHRHSCPAATLRRLMRLPGVSLAANAAVHAAVHGAIAARLDAYSQDDSYDQQRRWNPSLVGHI